MVCQMNTGGMVASTCFSIDSSSSSDASSLPSPSRLSETAAVREPARRDYRIAQQQRVWAHGSRIISGVAQLGIAETVVRFAANDHRPKTRWPPRARHPHAIRRHARESSTSLRPSPATPPGTGLARRSISVRTPDSRPRGIAARPVPDSRSDPIAYPPPGMIRIAGRRRSGSISGLLSIT